MEEQIQHLSTGNHEAQNRRRSSLTLRRPRSLRQRKEWQTGNRRLLLD